MQLFVRRSDGSTLSLIQERSASVHDIKSQIESTEGIPSFLQTITFCGSRLDDEQILDSCIDSEIANIELNVDLLGGGKKRKKKVYTTPKKIKRKPKKVEPNGKISRLRRECPNKECGAGVFMASHFDRQYCGKCGLTYMHANK